jgi:hypothetical protein
MSFSPPLAHRASPLAPPPCPPANSWPGISGRLCPTMESGLPAPPGGSACRQPIRGARQPWPESDRMNRNTASSIEGQMFEQRDPIAPKRAHSAFAMVTGDSRHNSASQQPGKDSIEGACPNRTSQKISQAPPTRKNADLLTNTRPRRSRACAPQVLAQRRLLAAHRPMLADRRIHREP